MINKLIIRYFVIYLVALVIFGAASSSCSSKNGAYIEDEGIAHFSLEYPADYNIISPLRSNHVVSVLLSREVVKNGWSDKWIYICARTPESFSAYPGVYDAKTMMKSIISAIKADFKTAEILDESQGEVAGIQGYTNVLRYDRYSVRNPLPDPYPPGYPEGPSLIEITRGVYFDHGGLIWCIRIKSTEELAEEAKTHFDHVIQTFKILE